MCVFMQVNSNTITFKIFMHIYLSINIGALANTGGAQKSESLGSWAVKRPNHQGKSQIQVLYYFISSNSPDTPIIIMCKK